MVSAQFEALLSVIFPSFAFAGVAPVNFFSDEEDVDDIFGGDEEGDEDEDVDTDIFGGDEDEDDMDGDDDSSY